MNPRQQAQAARAASRVLQALPSAARSAALHRVADALLSRQAELLEQNALDVADAKKAVEAGKMSGALAARLNLSTAKLETLAKGIRSIADAPEPLGRVLRRTEVAEGMLLHQETAALGVLLVIFESRPDAVPQLATLALRAGNGIILKGGKEARRSNRALHTVITEALAPDVPAAVVGLVETRDEVADLLGMDDVIDLVIPRGSGALVRHVQNNTRIPVLGHAEGICHVYVDRGVDVASAARIVVDAKIDYPAACNAMETLLLHADLVGDGRGATIVTALQDAGVTLYGDAAAAEAFGLEPVESFRTEYGDLAASVAVVPSTQAAIDHIHRFGSAHTDCILTDDDSQSAQFLAQVDSACVFHNCSTRFSDGYRFGLGAEVGISTSRIHARGPVGVDGLLTTRWKLAGSGQTVAQFGRGESVYTHRSLPIDEPSR